MEEQAVKDFMSTLDNMSEEDRTEVLVSGLMSTLDNMSEEDCTEVLVSGLIQSNTPMEITRDQNGKLLYVRVYKVEDNSTQFEISTGNFRERMISRVLKEAIAQMEKHNQ